MSRQLSISGLSYEFLALLQQWTYVHLEARNILLTFELKIQKKKNYECQIKKKPCFQ